MMGFCSAERIRASGICTEAVGDSGPVPFLKPIITGCTLVESLNYV